MTVLNSVFYIHSVGPFCKLFLFDFVSFSTGISSARQTMTKPVMIAERTSAMAHPPNTIERASLTPVMSTRVTNRLSGTRDSTDSVVRCSLGMLDERSMPVIAGLAAFQAG